MHAIALQELKYRVLAVLRSQKEPVTAEQILNHPEISSALFQALQTALVELKAEGKIKGRPLGDGEAGSDRHP